jgi:short-subunit dehydrogenase
LYADSFWGDNSMAFESEYGPWALISGASSGIGEAFAKALAEKKLNLVLVARRLDRLQALAETLQKNHAIECKCIATDLSDVSAINAMLCETQDLDIGLIISNAGFGLKGPHHLNNADEMQAMINVNCTAPTLISHHFTPRLIERKRGGLIITGSMEGYLGFPYSAAYAASKAYVHSLGESLWVELGQHGIDTLVLAPGATDTEALSLQGFDAKDMPNLMSGEDVAHFALKKLKQGPIQIAGTANRIATKMLAALPRRWGVRASGKAMWSSLPEEKKIQ